MAQSTGRAGISDGRLLRGQRIRQLISARAVDVASAEGLDSLSLARLGADLDISKSGVKGHFASRLDLQLAVTGVAARLYIDRVVTPAMTKSRRAASPMAFLRKLDRVHAIRRTQRPVLLPDRSRRIQCPAWPIRDELLRLRLEWGHLFTASLHTAVRLGHLSSAPDDAQLFYEVAALIAGATLEAQLRHDPGVFDRARAATLTRLRLLAAAADVLPVS